MKSTLKSLTSINIIENVILRELKTIVYSADCASAPYIKFLMIANCIEFIGACWDVHEYDEKNISETRFNNCLKKYFPKKYHKYAKERTPINLYDHFRCGMVHQLRPLGAINLTQRNHGFDNLEEKGGKLYLVLEDFYDDLASASQKFINSAKTGSVPKRTKTQADFLHIDFNVSGSTKENIIDLSWK